ncbi:hypothetical protein BRN52_02950 [Xanthomonas oryzae pv. oryzae]|uniref:hypothetical protein n=1 Tax=Xanthomonas oryzae TaxID=347 RepID=UPI0005CE7DC6|nr:hypothetical protein [Xanthomonas oryzae]AJQ81709.1 hypothetical protein AZ54_02965 [Xanthomonas oryzae pv. oryzae PXO86]ALZ70584.1 hypothetical protein APZ20_02715 [Xanthomonas oryzae pv. oryzae]AOS05252.1 hypothetical protein ATY43_02825 [Xanthomonas oryzae pv. oryzae]AOS09411.1 hypothetical protein ATY44_02745 [Xanthomonas oryzae pv. oryzae]AXM31141.1 hypothetical protein BRN52_02950 [Xanthomonas oryzae pv. oryzae]
MRAVITTLVLLWLALLSGVANAGSRAQARALETTQAAYTAAVRWNDFDTAQGFVEPAYAQAHPLSDLERSRYEQIQISGYRELRVSEDPNGDLRREVELRVINRNTQAERLVRGIEIWRWNPKQKRWWLASGLPDLWKGQ